MSCQSDSGYDAGKKIKGRKRHIVVDTLGIIICAWVTSADWQDRVVARWLFLRMYLNRVDFPRLQIFFADAGHTGKLVDFVKNQFINLGWQLSRITRDQKSRKH